MEEQFKISSIFLSLFNISVWAGITYFLYDWMDTAGFPLHFFLCIPVWLVLTYIFLINSVQVIIEQVKLLGNKK